MDQASIIVIFFFYGLAFFSMGLAITLELSQCSNLRLKRALRPLAVFGLLHGSHEWLEMFDLIGLLPDYPLLELILIVVRLSMLAWSFLSLAAFGAYLLAPTLEAQRLSLLLPLGLTAVWGFGMILWRGKYPVPELWDVADVWTRYVLAIPGSVTASLGLIAKQRDFRREGLTQFGRDSLWAAVAFFWYGLIGQVFTRYSLLPPSTTVNQGLFLQLFGFPVQLLRASAAITASFFIIRFLRSFEVEVKKQLEELQQSRLEAAQKREALRGEILRRIVEAQEAERGRIARELHDETGQSLTALGLGLRGVATLLRQDIDKAAANLRRLEGMTVHSLNELQRLIADLRPSHLDDLGLSAALRWYASEVQSRVDLKLDLQILGDKRDLPPEMKTAIFRIIQEAVNNVVKHAQASFVQINLIYDSQVVIAQVNDNGRGFVVDDPSEYGRKAFGLMGMRERASLLGGEVKIQSYPGRGTKIEATIPYPSEWLEEEGE